MTKQEQLFAAIGGIDDDIAANALKPSERCRRKIPLKIVLIAAAAAAISLLVGFTVIFKNTVEQNGKPLLEYKVKVHNEIVFPSVEELTEMGAFTSKDEDGIPGVLCDPIPGQYFFVTKTDPRTVIEEYGLNLIINNNDNFIRADSEKYPESENGNILYWMHVFVGGAPYYEDWGQNTRVEFLFALVNKRLDIPVSFGIECYYGELLGPVSGKIYDWSECEMIEMNNGEKVLIELVDYPDYYEQLADSPPETRAYFTYDGIVYYVLAETDIDGMKEVLADLGVL